MKQRLVIAVIVKEGMVLSFGTNEHECKRVGMPTGEGYELCEGCQYQNHAEAKALFGWAVGYFKGATLYLFGHEYICKPCDERIKYERIEKVIIV